jgi:hypothetical protein
MYSILEIFQVINDGGADLLLYCSKTWHKDSFVKVEIGKELNASFLKYRPGKNKKHFRHASQGA